MFVPSSWHLGVFRLNKIRGTLGCNGGTAETKRRNLEGPGYSNVVPKSSSILLCKGIIFHSVCINAFANSTLTKKGGSDSRDAVKKTRYLSLFHSVGL